MTWPLLRSRTAATVVFQDWPVRDCTTMVRPTSSEGSTEGIAEVDGAPLVIIQAVGPPSWERACSQLGGIGCSGSDEHAFVFEGALEAARIHALMLTCRSVRNRVRASWMSGGRRSSIVLYLII